MFDLKNRFVVELLSSSEMTVFDRITGCSFVGDFFQVENWMDWKENQPL